MLDADMAKAPLSFSQQRIWVFSQVSAEGAIYNVPFGFDVKSGLNISAFKQAVNFVVKRHAVLRTTYHHESYIPFQRSHTIDELPIEMIDLRHYDAQDQDHHFYQQVDPLAKKPFDYENELPIKVKLFRLSDSGYRIFFIISHIAFDGWSVGVFNKELAEAYNHFLVGKIPPLSDLTYQYQDYAKAQREREASGHYVKSLDYWKTQLEFPLQQLDLADLTPKTASTAHGNTVEFHFDRELSDSIQKLAKSHRSSMYGIMLSLFKAAIYGMKGFEDIIVGSPFANRHYPGVDNLLGFFVNMLPVRTRVKGDMTFKQLSTAIKYYVLNSFEHQEQPIEPLLHHVRSEVSPLVHVLFSVQDIELPALEFDDVSYERLTIDAFGSKMDMTLVFYVTAEGIRGEIEYNTEIFSINRLNQIITAIEDIARLVISDVDVEPTLDALAMLCPNLPDRAAKKAATNTDKPAAIVQSLPANNVQQLIYHNSENSKSVKFLIDYHMQVSPVADIKQLESIYRDIIENTPNLRATFSPLHGQLLCHIRDKGHADFELVDLRALSESSQMSTIKKQVAKQRAHPMNLAEDVLLRCKVFLLSDDRCVLSLFTHHLLLDGISFTLLQQTLIKRFIGAEVDVDASQMSNYLDAHQQQLRDAGQIKTQAQPHLNRLTETLKGGKAFNWLADVDYSQRTRQQPNSSRCIHEYKFSPATLAGLQSLSKQHRVTPYVTGMALFGLMVACHSDAEVFHIYSPNGGRSQAEFANTLGLFLNWNIYQVDMSSELSLSELIQALKGQYYAHVEPNFPHLKLIKAHLSDLPIKQLSYGIQSYNEQTTMAQQMADKTGKAVEIDYYVPPFIEAKQDLSFYLVDQWGDLYGAFTYNTELFNHGSMVKMEKTFDAMVAYFVDDAKRKTTIKLLRAEQLREAS